jgi:hypothetical protein
MENDNWARPKPPEAGANWITRSRSLRTMTDAQKPTARSFGADFILIVATSYANGIHECERRMHTRYLILVPAMSTAVTSRIVLSPAVALSIFLYSSVNKRAFFVFVRMAN